MKTYMIFRTLGSGSLSVTVMLDFSGKANTSIHGLGQDKVRATESGAVTEAEFCINPLAAKCLFLSFEAGIADAISSFKWRKTSLFIQNILKNNQKNYLIIFKLLCNLFENFEQPIIIQ